jgi:hypothetical protein
VDGREDSELIEPPKGAGMKQRCPEAAAGEAEPKATALLSQRRPVALVEFRFVHRTRIPGEGFLSANCLVNSWRPAPCAHHPAAHGHTAQRAPARASLYWLGFPKRSSAASVKAEIPVLRVGMRSGAKRAEWTLGTVVPACFAFASAAGSAAPRKM